MYIFLSGVPVPFRSQSANTEERKPWALDGRHTHSCSFPLTFPKSSSNSGDHSCISMSMSGMGLEWRSKYEENHWPTGQLPLTQALNWVSWGSRRTWNGKQIYQGGGWSSRLSINAENAHLCICSLCQQLPTFRLLSQMRQCDGHLFKDLMRSCFTPRFGLSSGAEGHRWCQSL